MHWRSLTVKKKKKMRCYMKIFEQTKVIVVVV